MSGGGRSLLLLLQRCVTGRQTRLLSGIQAEGSLLPHRSCHPLQQLTRATLYRQRSFQPLPLLTVNHTIGFCTKVSSSCCCNLGYTDQRWHRLPFSGGKIARIIRIQWGENVFGFFCRCLLKAICCFSVGRSTIGGWVPASASLRVRTRKGGLHCASERSAMVLLSWGSPELLLRWAIRKEKHVCSYCYSSNQSYGIFPDIVIFICNVISRLLAPSSLSSSSRKLRMHWIWNVSFLWFRLQDQRWRQWNPSYHGQDGTAVGPSLPGDWTCGGCQQGFGEAPPVHGSSLHWRFVILESQSSRTHCTFLIDF